MRVSQEDFEATKFLGGVVGAKYPFLKQLAMVNKEERELIGYIECLKIIVKNGKTLESEDLDKIMSKVFVPILEAIGQSKFIMGEISHLACKIGSQKKRYKLNELPTFEPIQQA